MGRGPNLEVVMVVVPFELKFHIELSFYAILELPFLGRILVQILALDSKQLNCRLSFIKDFHDFVIN